jgi:predicted N-acetyltransferase YhbS
MATTPDSEIVIRRATPADAGVCGAICFAAFDAISSKHGFACDLPSAEVATRSLTMMFSNPGFYCVVAESGGRIIGSNCMDERAMIAGIGPITVDPGTQNHGVGRALMLDVMERARHSRPAGVRLVQAAFHSRSLSLYTNLGFDVREPLACVQGQPREARVIGCEVRLAREADFDACNELSRRVHGFDRATELAEMAAREMARVVVRDGRITGYASALAFIGHATAESNLDMQALITSAETFGGPGILVPSRNAELLRWCLGNGLRITQPMTLMTIGLYNEPSGAWFPSILF